MCEISILLLLGTVFIHWLTRRHKRLETQGL
jgi:hypothetical protein